VAKLIYRFEEFRLDTMRRELTRGGASVALEPQVFDLLEYLLRHRDRVASRDDIFSAVWDGRIVSDATLSTRINAVRSAIGDNGDEQRLIRTFRRKGLRFVGTVLEEPASDTMDRKASGPSLRLTLPEKPSMVVLPFANLSGDPGQDYFADGIVDDITIALGRIPWLFVISNHSAFTYKGRLTGPKQIGAELGVRYVLQGSVRKSEKHIRISARLIDALDEKQIWADNFDGEMANVFETQDRVAAAISARITPQLRVAEVERIRHRPTDNFTAYDLFLRALPPHRDSLVQSEESLKILYRAIALDPNFGAAYGLAAYYYLVQVVYDWLPISDPLAGEGLRLAHLAADRGENDPDALWMAGRTMAVIGGEIHHGHALIDRALALNPNLATAWWARGMSHAFLGQRDLAIADFSIARRLNPLDPSGHAHWLGMAFAYFFDHEYESAREAIDKALAQWPASTPAVQLKAAICGHLGQIEEGRACLRRVRAVNRRSSLAALQAQFEPRLRGFCKGLSNFLEGLRVCELTGIQP
jgi:TolB-like protein